ncbi:uroporphyrinogen-III C-methyltransferase [Pseudoclavibacter endophyticus]|uniref:Nitrite reductase small subunit NirD n=1 Tax=Pseudoclavibacter endophyticus TaxID=1778590 RepID=A0A6H9WNX3_9MICO|nr:nitrite reductase small subunit NirD [Pseudoclavibacter endophyticus]KAB1649798.1 nitrite reductase small subunit NirD [Pseudoclavibacter endophyticus]GGA59669.1 uroporphyrinogen-III C-methyltransferase [Pseudoclavibacter endophyticus]
MNSTAVLTGPAVAHASVASPDGPWTRVCRYDDLDPVWGVAALVASGTQVALFRLQNGNVYATSNVDPKTGAMVLSRGLVGEKRVEGETVPTIASPLHKDVFDLRTGRCFTSPELRLPIWRARVDGGDVSVAPPAAMLAVSHGTSDEHGRTAVLGLVEAVRAAVPGAPVHGGFVDVQQPDVPAALATADADAIVVPLLLATGYHVKHDIARDVDAHTASHAAVTRALGPDPRLASVLALRLAEVDWSPARDALVLIVAGSSDTEATRDGIIAGELLAELLRVPVAVGALAGAGAPMSEVVARIRAEHPDRRLVGVSYLLAPGYFQSVAESAGTDVTTRPLLTPDEPAAPELVAIVKERYLGALPPRRPHGSPSAA